MIIEKKIGNVLSLFDGMSCGQIALNKIGIEYDTYFASEIEDYAMSITMKNYPDTVQIGDVTKVRYEDGILYTENGEFNVGKIDLLFGGSPCQGFSLAGKQLNFEDPRSILFFEFLRIKNEIQKYNPDLKFLLENVKMKEEVKDIISENIGIQPMRINSSLLSSGLRDRLYWMNWNVEVPEDKNIYLKDIIESGVVDRDKSLCITRRYVGFTGSQGYLRHRYFGKAMGQAVFEGNATPDDHKKLYNKVQRDYSVENNTIDGFIRSLTPLECERVMTIPDNYSLMDGVDDNKRKEMIGNAWTVDVIVHIFSYMN